MQIIVPTSAPGQWPWRRRVVAYRRIAGECPIGGEHVAGCCRFRGWSAREPASARAWAWAMGAVATKG